MGFSATMYPKSLSLTSQVKKPDRISVEVGEYIAIFKGFAFGTLARSQVVKVSSHFYS